MRGGKWKRDGFSGHGSRLRDVDAHQLSSSKELLLEHTSALLSCREPDAAAAAAAAHPEQSSNERRARETLGEHKSSPKSGRDASTAEAIAAAAGVREYCEPERVALCNGARAQGQPAGEKEVLYEGDLIGVHGAAAIAAESNSPSKVASAASNVTRGIIPPPDHNKVDDDARNIQERRFGTCARRVAAHVVRAEWAEGERGGADSLTSR